MAYSAELYVHDLDRQAADALNQFPKFVKLLESYSANYDEKAAKIDLLSTAIRLGENQMPEVYGLLPPICEQLGIDTPELYYVRDKRANAATFGSVHPCIYVTSGLVNKLPLNLLPSVLAHECGHIACKHSLYHSIAAQLVGGIDRSPLVRIPAIGKYLTPTLVRALLFWDRCSELSADRAAALCDGTADKTIDVLLRINGYGKNVDRKEFLKQALDLKSFVNDSKSNKLMELMLVQDETHPRLATRAYECYEWSQSAQYAGIIDGTFTLPDKTKEINQELAEDVASFRLAQPAQTRIKPGLFKNLKTIKHLYNHT
ncbi:MAG: M48 family metallopeptidase [Oscillospiraceae bacterium]|jgi:peptidase M48 ste24p